jgi:3-phenylpropionate/trans-cinnamate dioxygenase ferredoxin reductase subunit
MTDRIVIVGGGLAAARVARAFRDAGGDGQVTILSADTDPPYNRPPLSKGFLRGEIEADAVFVEPETTYAELDIDLRLGCTVTGVQPAEGTVALADGSSLPYDRLVLASGSLPRALGTPGETLEGVHTYRTLKDASAVRSAAESASSALVWRRPPRCAGAGSRSRRSISPTTSTRLSRHPSCRSRSSVSTGSAAST